MVMKATTKNERLISVPRSAVVSPSLPYTFDISPFPDLFRGMSQCDLINSSSTASPLFIKALLLPFI
jgi:hypothetical protein